MKYNKISKALFFVLTVFLFVSCEKNQPPSIQFLNPADGFTATKGDIVSISLSAEDEEGSVSEVRLYINEEGLASLDFPYNFELNTDDYRSGSFTLKATAKDDEGLKSSMERFGILPGNG